MTPTCNSDNAVQLRPFSRKIRHSLLIHRAADRTAGGFHEGNSLGDGNGLRHGTHLNLKVHARVRADRHQNVLDLRRSETRRGSFHGVGADSNLRDVIQTVATADRILHGAGVLIGDRNLCVGGTTAPDESRTEPRIRPVIACA